MMCQLSHLTCFEQIGLVAELRFSTWDLRPFTAGSEFLVAMLAPPRDATDEPK